MTTIGHQVRHLVDRADAPFCLGALHHHHFSVVIHSPRTSTNGLFSVTAYGEGRPEERLCASSKRLVDAIEGVAAKLGGIRLKIYAQHLAEQRLERAL